MPQGNTIIIIEYVGYRINYIYIHTYIYIYIYIYIYLILDSGFIFICTYNIYKSNNIIQRITKEILTIIRTIITFKKSQGKFNLIGL